MRPAPPSSCKASRAALAAALLITLAAVATMIHVDVIVQWPLGGPDIFVAPPDTNIGGCDSDNGVANRSISWLRPANAVKDAEVKQAELWSFRAGSCACACASAHACTAVATARATHMSSASELAIGAIAQKESPYIEEWVLYHLFIGVDMIYLFDNEDEPTYHMMFECNPRVLVVHYPWDKLTYPERGAQLSATADFLDMARAAGHKWVMFPDTDEYLVTLDFPNIKDYLRPRVTPETPAIAFQWIAYLYSQRAYKEDLPSLERFNYRHTRLDKHIKTLYMLDAVLEQRHPHYPAFKDPTAKVRLAGNDTAYQPQTYPFATPSDSDSDPRVFLLHFYTRSIEEYVARREFRDSPDTPLGTGVKQHFPTSRNATMRAAMRAKVMARVQQELEAGTLEKYLGRLDNTMREFWRANLDQLYRAMRVYRPDDPKWPSAY